MSITIFVGDIHESLGQIAKQHDPSAFLIDRNNYHTVVNRNDSFCAYTSKADLVDLGKLRKILSKATTIYYCPPKVWSDRKQYNVADVTSSAQGLTEVLLLSLRDQVNIVNLPKPSVKTTLIDARKTIDSQFWITGCSITLGVGVEDHERWGDLVAAKFNKEFTLIAQSGGSIQWAADQLLRSDIRPGDTIIWGLTSCNRLTYYTNQKILHISAPYYLVDPNINNIVPLHLISDENIVYQNITAIERVRNICSKLGINLVIFPAMLNHELTHYLHSIPEFIPCNSLYGDQNKDNLENYYIDLGTDNLHPGPLQHQLFADLLYNKLKN